MNEKQTNNKLHRKFNCTVNQRSKLLYFQSTSKHLIYVYNFFFKLIYTKILSF
jgi:hypothetical protein